MLPGSRYCDRLGEIGMYIYIYSPDVYVYAWLTTSKYLFGKNDTSSKTRMHSKQRNFANILDAH